MPKTTSYKSSAGICSRKSISNEQKTVLRITLVAFAVLLVFSLAAAPASATAWDGTNNTTWYEGHESESSFTISTAEQLAGLAYLVNGGTNFYPKTITLGADLDLGGYPQQWTPIGIDDYYHAFKGTFDGMNHTISNLYINATTQYQGLFGYINGAGTTIKNLGVINVNVTGPMNVGGLVGLMIPNTKIENCYATGTVTGTGSSIGGLVGNNGGTIENCYATGAVTGKKLVGGLVGQNDANSGTATITNCYATGAVTGNNYVGGLVGQNDADSGTATITNSVALNPSVSATASGANVGRVVGLNSGINPKIENCYAWNRISGEWNNKSIDNIDGKDATSAQVWANPDLYTSLGWDISAGDTTIWKINQDDGTNYPLPYLKETRATRAQVEYLKPTQPTPTPTPAPEQPSGGSSTDTGSGHYTNYPRTVSDGGSVSFGSSPIVTGVDMPEGVTGSVELITVVVTDTDGREYYATFEINAPESADGGNSLIYFELDLKKIEADGYTVKDVVLSHKNEDGTWTDLKTTYLGTKDGKAKYSAENTVGYSVFAIYYTEGASIEDTEPAVTAVVPTTEPEPTYVEPAYVEPTMPATVPTAEQTKSPVGLVGLGLGLLGAAVVLRRK